MKFWCTLIVILSLCEFFHSNIAYGQAGIRAQGRDINLNTPGQGAEGSLVLQGARNYQQEMRKFIKSISKFTRRLDPNFIVVIKDGLDLLEKGSATGTATRSPAITYIRTIDGLLVSGLNFRPPLPGKDEIKTNAGIQKQILRLAKLGKRRGLKVWVTDYAPNEQIAKDVVVLNRANGFVSFAAKYDDYIFSQIPSYPRRPINENPKNITGLKVAHNFLYMTDSSFYDKQEDFLGALSNTNYDAVITDVFHRGRKPFKKNIVRGFKFKKVGAKRLVLAEMDIGHADSSRYYWKSGWGQGNPAYMGLPTPSNPDRYYVQYWYKAWQDLITGKPNSYVYGIFKQGFDGVVITGAEAYQAFEGTEE